MNPPEEIIRLIERFETNLDAYKSGRYNETQVRQEFINPFFKSLGWDVDNEKGWAEAYKDVVHEDAIKIGKATKAPDYCFRIGGARKFFLEAKKPSVDIKKDIHPAYQLRRYAWSAKLPLSILTDFEEFAVYDCRFKPVKTDKASTARIMYLNFRDYVAKWEELSSIFSREAILKGSFDRYIESGKKKRGTAEVDSAFLKEIESWRENLARNIALRNTGLTQRAVNFSVQKIIDRIIFLRISEDRGLESEGALREIGNKTGVYHHLCELFKKADKRYNSGIFHFKNEKDIATHPDELTLTIKLDDTPLKAILKNLYYPDSPYEFSVLPADILGHVYEQFLGKVIRLTPSHRAVIEEKPEVRKAGGVYYTPTYIVDYIVKNTVGKLLEGRTPAHASKLKILDPACGSGSFLIGAYQYLLDWHLEQYQEILKKTKRIPRIAVAGPGKTHSAIYQGAGGDWRLTLYEKKRILLNNIYGVDIDDQAVEVTKLSLLLKVLEGESQLHLFHERILPDLGSNIKCGNSLIGPDFYENQPLDLFDEKERYRINVFDWKAEFPEILSGPNPGFDAVIGNPPYVRQEMLGEYKNYFQINYKTYHGLADLYTYFIEKAVNLLNTGGIFSYIVANKWMRANYGLPLRKWLKENQIKEILDFGDLKVFTTATTYPCIIIVKKGQPGKKFNVVNFRTIEPNRLNDIISETKFGVNVESLDDAGWSLMDTKNTDLIAKLKKVGKSLSEYVDGGIYRGVLSGFDRAFVIDEETKSKLIKEHNSSAKLIKPYLAGKDVKRYGIKNCGRYLIFTRRGINIDSYPAIKKYLEQYKERLMPKPRNWKGKKWPGRKYGSYEWYEIQDSVDYYRELEKPKIIYLKFQVKPTFTYDISNWYGNSAIWFIPTSELYILGILNSKLGWFMVSNSCTRIQNGYQLIWDYFKKIPIYTIDSDNPEDKVKHDKMVNLVDQMLKLNKQLSETNTSHDKTAIQRQIDTTDHQIDQLVYDLYDLTPDEIKIIEEND